VTERNWSEEFDATFARQPSSVQERVWMEVFGDEYPVGVDPYSYVSRSELERFAAELRIGPGDVFADVGCGRGGAGVWIATRTRARLIGLDIAASALEAARSRAAAAGLDDAEFVLGSFEETGLAAAAVDAIMSVDALLFTPDKAAALRELGRVLRPGGRLVLTTWDYSSPPPGRPPQVADHRPLLRPAGLRLVAYEETADWRFRVEATTAGLIAAVDELAADENVPRDDLLVELEEMQAAATVMLRRILLVAERS
jgi:SAM-dependent methyltransferase